MDTKKVNLKKTPNSGNSKLSNSEILLLKKMLKKGVSVPVIIKLFKISKSQVYRIKNGIQWKNISILILIHLSGILHQLKQIKYAI